MSISIEDILRSHGIGGGGGGGVKVITSTTQPTTGLTDGLVWYEPTLRKTKMYLGGEFQEVGGGGLILTTLHARFKTTAIASEVSIPVMNAAVPSLNYNPSTDILIVSQNGTNITESIDYTIDKVAKKIVKTSGTWDDKTVFDFTAIVPTSTSQKEGVETVQIEDHVSVAAGVSQVSFSISGFNTDVDLLEVHQRNMKIFKTRDWVLDPSGAFITLTEATAEPEEFHFTVTKKIRSVASGELIDGSVIVDNSITKEKLDDSLKDSLDKVDDIEQSINDHVDDIATLSKLGHVKAKTNPDGTLILPPSELVIEKFENPGITTWVVPEGVTKVYVSGAGGGGGGGGGGAGSASGGLTSFGSYLSLPGGAGGAAGGAAGGPGGSSGGTGINIGGNQLVPGGGGGTIFGSGGNVGQSPQSQGGYGAGSAGSANTYGTGGGGGASVIDEPIVVTPLEAITITIGSGGTGAVGASSGGNGFILIKYVK